MNLHKRNHLISLFLFLSILQLGCSPGLTNQNEADITEAQTFERTTTTTVPPTSGVINFCPQYNNVVVYTQPWGAGRIETRSYGYFYADGVEVIKITVPAGLPSSTWGSVTIGEFDGPPTYRQLTLSKSPCDFRSQVDPNNVNGPMAFTGGNSTTVYFTLGTPSAGYPEGAVKAGETFYINARNWDPFNNRYSCQITACNAVFGFQWH